MVISKVPEVKLETEEPKAPEVIKAQAPKTKIIGKIDLEAKPKKEKEAVSTEAQANTGHMNIALYWFGETLDPALDWDGWTLTRAAVGETLVTVDENLQLVGQLADSWENVDETTWKFHIRQGVTFQNGNPLTPEAVKASIERTVKMNERGEDALKLASIDVDGEYVIIKTKSFFI